VSRGEAGGALLLVHHLGRMRRQWQFTNAPLSLSPRRPAAGSTGGWGWRECAWTRRHVCASRPNGTMPDLASPQPNGTIPSLLASPGAGKKTPKETSRSLCWPDTGPGADSLRTEQAWPGRAWFTRASQAT
jgi:hypothetical protein